MKELFIERFDESNLRLFWREVLSIGKSSDIDIYIDYETADLFACHNKGGNNQELLVKMFAFEACKKWDNIADSEITDDEYERVMTRNINTILTSLKTSQPEKFENIRYSSNFFDDSLSR